MELLKHVAKHPIDETNEAKDLKDQGEEIIHIEEGRCFENRKRRQQYIKHMSLEKFESLSSSE